MKIVPISILRDNYVWAATAGGRACIIDPGEVTPVTNYLQTRGLQLDAILITHKHWDHTDGAQPLAELYRCPVYGPLDAPGVTERVREGDVLSLLNNQFHVLEVPGHTEDHIAYFIRSKKPILFCGDTLFSAGCGRILGGTAEQFKHSLDRLKQLPPETQLYCTHEYTQSNIAFAAKVMPSNRALQARKQTVEELRATNRPSLPVSLADECQYNPFLRCDDADIITSLKQHRGLTETDELSVFKQLRAWKDNF